MIVETNYGKVEGNLNKDFYEFLGIPYAAPPVGQLRFMPPEKPQKWSGVKECKHFSKICPQANPKEGQVASEEECLTLNVYTPACDDSKRPVFFWVHGGAFQSGSSLSGMSNPETFTNEGLVVVSCNYRLGAFGFMQLDHLLGEKYQQSGNCGMLDVIAAIEWAKENIAQFGGDPNQITIVGESAGAKMVSAILLSNKGRKLVNRVIMQSGAAQCIRDKHTAQVIADRIIEQLGLTKETASEILTMPWQQIIEAQKTVINGSRNLHSVGPVFDGINFDGDDALQLAKSVEGINVLCGTNHDEYNLFALGKGIDKLDDTLAKGLFGLYKDFALANAKERKADESLTNFVAMMSDYIYRNGTVLLANALAENPNNGGIYLYRFDYDNTPLGAAHSLELAFVFGARSAAFGGIENNEDFPTMAKLMQSHWFSFVRTGKPKENWTTYDPNNNPNMMCFDTPESKMIPSPQPSVGPEVPYCMIKL